MSILEKFNAYAEALPPERRREIDDLLASIMESDSPEFDLTPDELAELDRRMADPHPEYADPKDIAAIFGTTFRD
jgi:hypothetical protein